MHIGVAAKQLRETSHRPGVRKSERRTPPLELDPNGHTYSTPDIALPKSMIKGSQLPKLRRAEELAEAGV